LQVLLPVEGNSTSLHFALLIVRDLSESEGGICEKCFPDLDIDFVSAEHNGDVLANALEVTMPVGNVFVGDTGGDVEHDDPALALDVVPISQTSELLLSSGVPDVEANGSKVGGELKRVNLNTESG
jgi:hypothetical protein